MTKAGERILAGLEEATKVAKGEVPAARIYHQGFAYVPAQAVLDERERCAFAAKDAALCLRGWPVSEEQAESIAAAIRNPT